MDNKESRFEKLAREGWKRQFMASEPRLSEAIELYTATGQEVHLESPPTTGEIDACPQGEAGECRVCFEGDVDQYKIIYTRPSKDAPDLDEDLF